MHSLNDIRAAFLDFFVQHDHLQLPSSPLVPLNDPTLMFTNAGMVQFKHIFTGAETPPSPPRATTAQKCVRAGGKHNDLDNVGYTARHHTFFEMLGNFSFGDYFKEDAIIHAWKFLTKTLALPPEKLFITVYHTDDAAFDLWKKTTGFREEKILRVATKDNFWAMGDTGPCGPCSEIFYDHGESVTPGEWALGSDGNDLFGERYVEIWNLVFMQHEKREDGSQIDLPKPSIDTGMGLERMAAIMQGVHDNYDTDLFRHLITAIQETAGTNDAAHNASFRVIVDHLRACSFLIADGVMPSNEGRGYVLRRIMRRAMRHAHILGCKDPLMHRLVPSLIHEMGAHYPELGRAESAIKSTLQLEEERFRETLGKGLKILEENTTSLKQGDKLAGDVAFKLYDTYGFPLDLTEDILRSQEIAVDTEGFDAAMEEQRARARAAWKGSGDASTEELWFDLQDTHGATEFLGYDSVDANGKILAIVKDGALVEEAKKSDTIQLLTNQTPFYAESGGQAGDYGQITSEQGAITISDTVKKLGNLHVHCGMVENGTVHTGEVATLHVDTARRTALRANHSATHLLHAALRNILGDHVTQKGSLVEARYLRFDFSHPQAVTPEELVQIEAEVNRLIRQNTAISTTLMTPEEAIEQGAMALFGEKYGKEVRVLSMGEGDDTPYSVELCGGTHVTHTGDIGFFHITGESSVAAGIRRIEAITAAEAASRVSDYHQLLDSAATRLKIDPASLPTRIEELLEERKTLEKELAQARKQLAIGGSDAAAHNDTESDKEEIAGIAFIGKTLPDLPPKELKNLADAFKQQLGSGVVAVIATNEGKASVVIGVTADLTERIDAVELVRVAAETLGGKGGGGRPDLAQAGGPDASKADAALNAVKQRLTS